MVERISALTGEYTIGRFGAEGEVGVTLCEVMNLTLSQVAVWPDTLAATGTIAAKAVGAPSVPGPGRATVGTAGTVLRIEPLKFWLVGANEPQLAAEQGVTLDLSHSRTHIQVFGPKAATLLNRFLPLDLRDVSFPVWAVASTTFDHVGVTVWRSGAGFELFLPRGFSLSLWEVLLQGAAQFGCEIAVPC